MKDLDYELRIDHTDHLNTAGQDLDYLDHGPICLTCECLLRLLVCAAPNLFIFTWVKPEILQKIISRRSTPSDRNLRKMFCHLRKMFCYFRKVLVISEKYIFILRKRKKSPPKNVLLSPKKCFFSPNNVWLSP